MFLTLAWTKLFKCVRVLSGKVCGLQFSTAFSLKEHMASCVWRCPVEGCNRTARKARDIAQHQSKHKKDEERRQALIDLIEENS